MPTLPSVALDSLKEVARNDWLSWLLFRTFRQQAIHNRLVAEGLAEESAHDELARRKAPSTLTADLEKLYPLAAHFPERALRNHFEDITWQQNNRDCIAVLALEKLNNTPLTYRGHDTNGKPDATSTAGTATYIHVAGNPVPATAPTQPELDEEFMARFYRYAGDISKPEAQRLWARLLAGEIRHPGSFSPYALDILRGMDKRDIAMFDTVSGFMFGNKLLCPVGSIPHMAGFLPTPVSCDEWAYYPAFERMKQLGLCSGLHEAHTLEVYPKDCEAIALRNGSIRITLPSKKILLVNVVSAHSAFFELAPLLACRPCKIDCVMQLGIELEYLGLDYALDISNYDDSETYFPSYEGILALSGKKRPAPYTGDIDAVAARVRTQYRRKR